MGNLSEIYDFMVVKRKEGVNIKMAPKLRTHRKSPYSRLMRNMAGEL